MQATNDARAVAQSRSERETVSSEEAMCGVIVFFGEPDQDDLGQGVAHGGNV